VFLLVPDPYEVLTIAQVFVFLLVPDPYEVFTITLSVVLAVFVL